MERDLQESGHIQKCYSVNKKPEAYKSLWEECSLKIGKSWTEEKT